jgi:predicted Zn-dependent protease with MMP-like domain
MNGPEPTLRRVLLASAGALAVGLGVVSIGVGFSDSLPLKVLQGIAVFAAGAVILGGMIVLALTRLGGWEYPSSEDEFEALVQRAEQLAAGGLDLEEEEEDEEEDTDEAEFRALVRSAVDELPLEFHRALEHVAIVISDGGREHRAYGLYQGDTVARDYFTDRILIFRDTLTRDFGHDPELLRAQVTRTVRHELAHHLGWGETGVRGLGL